MVFVKIILVCVAIVGTLAVAQRQHWFEQAGFVGGCSLAPTPPGEFGQWWSCKEGVLTGYPSLIRDNCSLKVVTGARQVWRCPQPINRPSAL
jgi:hypothetical protein